MPQLLSIFNNDCVLRSTGKAMQLIKV